MAEPVRDKGCDCANNGRDNCERVQHSKATLRDMNRHTEYRYTVHLGTKRLETHLLQDGGREELSLCQHHMR